jgi:prepilin-type N-terminal cleavage/methylation domain-containing protein
MISRSPMRRSGFTLIELLVATGVFLLGFTAAFGLFLVAIRYRTLSDSMSRLAWATSSLVNEVQIGNPALTGGPLPPSDYVGSGTLLKDKTTGAVQIDTDRFYSYAGSAGIWYLVERSTDLLGGDDANSPTVHISLVTLVDDTVDPDSEYNADGIPLRDLDRRLKLVEKPSVNQADYKISEPLGREAIDAMIRRGLALRTTAVVARRPWWM